MAQQQGRVQVDDLAPPEPLKVSQYNGDTYAPPEQPVEDHNLANIADALGTFSSSLFRYGRIAQRQQQRDQMAQENQAAQGTIGGMSHDDYMQAWKDGKLPAYQLPAPNLLVGKVAGRYSADDLINGLQQKVNSGEIDLNATNKDGSYTNDLPSLLTQQMQPLIQQYGQNSDYQSRGFMAGLYEKTLAAREALLKYQDGVRTKHMTDQLGGTAYNSFTDAITNAKTPEDAQQSVRQLYSDMGPNLPVKQKNPFLDTQLRNALQKMAQDPKTVDNAEAVLNADRIDPKTGQNIGPLANTGNSDPNIASQLVDIRKSIGTTKDAKQQSDANTAMQQQALQAMQRQDGSLAQIQPYPMTLPKTGKQVIVGESAKKDAALQYFNWSQQEAQASNRRLDDVLDREVKVAQASNIGIPHIEDQLKGAASSALNANLSSNPQAQDQVMKAYETYRYLQSGYQGWADSHLNLDKDTKKFFDTLDVVTKGGQTDSATAMEMAQGVASNRSEQNSPEDFKQKMQAVQNSVDNSINSSSWMDWMKSKVGLSDGVPTNVGLVRDQVSKYAKLLATSDNIDADKAIQLAQQYVAKTMFTVNGAALHNIPQLPVDDQKRLIDNKLNELLPQLQQRPLYKGLSKSDIMLTQMQDNSIRLTDKRTMQPIMLNEKHPDGTISTGRQMIYPQQLIDTYVAEEKAKADAARGKYGNVAPAAAPAPQFSNGGMPQP